MKARKPVKAPKTMPETPTILKMPREPKPESNNLGEVLGLKPKAERRDSTPPTPEPSTPPSKATTANTPQTVQTSADRAATPTGMPEPTGPMTALAGVTIRADVLTYGPDYHRARIRIITPTERYYKLVPGVRTATKAEALTAAQRYREVILASGQLPPKGERKTKAAATPKAPTPTPAPPPTGLVDVTRVEVD